MGFKKIRGINVSYEKQGRIFFALRNYHDLTDGKKKSVDDLIAKTARDDPAYINALRQWLIEGHCLENVAAENYVRQGTLIKYRKMLYENW